MPVRFLLVVFAGCLFSACDKVDELLTFRVSDKTSVTIQSTSPLSLPVSIPTPDIQTNSAQRFENNNTRADLVKDVKLEELRLTITNPSGKTFSFLKSIKFFISTTSSDEILAASLENVSSVSSTLELVPTTSKLDKYVKASSYKLRTEIVMKETLTQDVDVDVALRFKVTAAPL